MGGFESRPTPLKIWALLSWFDEDPDWLSQMVRSVAPLVDGVIAVDGAYALFPHTHWESATKQYMALLDACNDHGLEYHAYTPESAWLGGEVEKRAFLFDYAAQFAEPMTDWFLIMDADMYAGRETLPTPTRIALEQTQWHAASVTFHNLDPVQDSNAKVRPFRSLFRAIPGLTVDGVHSLYTVPDFEGNRLYMWQPIGKHEPVPALDLTHLVHLFHRPHLRPANRLAARANYYDRRSTANIEQIPDYAEERNG